MGKLKIRYLDISDTKKVEEFEQKMYTAYFGTTNTLELTRMIDIPNKRLRSKIAYENQKIIIAEEDGEMIGAMGTNFNMSDTLNLENIGFRIDKEEEGIAEGTGMFCTNPLVDGKLVMHELFQFGNTFLRENGYHTMYRFCGKKMKRSFSALGFEMLEEKIVMGEAVYLLKATEYFQ